MFFDLDNKPINWKLSGYSNINSERPRSNLHLAARDLLKEKYAAVLVLEEVMVPIRKGKIAYLDFYIPVLKICVEVNGEQHYKFNKFHHGTPQGFLMSQKRDRDKTEWLRVNGITVFELPFNKQDEWRDILNGSK